MPILSFGVNRGAGKNLGILRMIRLRTIPDPEPVKPPPSPTPSARKARKPAKAPAKAKKETKDDMTPAQMRAGRALLGWSQDQLATSAGIGLASVNNYERGKSDPRMNTVAKAQAVMAGVGVVFLPHGDERGEGVQFKLPPHIRPEKIDPPLAPPKKERATKAKRKA